jgi:hypothetical protein
MAESDEKEKKRLLKLKEKEDKVQAKALVRAKEKMEKEEAKAQAKKQKLKEKEDKRIENINKTQQKALIESFEFADKIVESEHEAISVIHKALSSRLRYSKGVLYFKKNNLWITDAVSIRASINVYVSEFGLLKKVVNDNGIKHTSFTEKRCVSVSITSGVLDKAIEESDDKWASSIFSSSLGKILFENGYYDFRKHKFFENDSSNFDHSIIFVEIIPFDFDLKADKDYIEDVTKRIFYNPFGKVVGDWYALMLARGLAGDCQKRFLVGIGKSNTGKSIMTSVCRSAMGGYFGAYSAACLKYKSINPTDEAQSLRWLMLLQTKRVIISSELQMGSLIDGNAINLVSNGGLDPIVARGHGGNETSFKIGFLPILFANDLNDITPFDSGQRTRVKCINYLKVAVENPTNDTFEMKLDPNLKHEIETQEFKNAFLWLLFKSYKKFDVEDKRNETEPSEVQAAIKEVLGDSCENVIEKFLKDFEITGAAEDKNNEREDKRFFVESTTILEWLKPTYISITKFARDFKQYLQMNNISDVEMKYMKVKGRTVRVWAGVKESDS